jgi:hypothetical protein
MSALMPVVITLAGVLVARYLLVRHPSSPSVWVTAGALGPAVGFGGLSLGYFAWRFAGFSPVGFRPVGWVVLMIVIAGGGILAWRARRSIKGPALDRTDLLCLGLIGAAVAVSIAAFVLYARQTPHGSYDAVAIWTSRARLLHRGTDLPAMLSSLRYAHPDYPLLLPGSLAAQFALAGSESRAIAQATGALFTLAAAGAVFASVRSFGGARHWAVLGGALALTTPAFLLWGSAQCADLPLAYVLLLAATALAAQTTDDPALPIPPPVAGFLLGLLAWTKNEGMVLTLVLLVVVGVFAVVQRRRQTAPLRVLSGALPLWLAVLLFRWVWAPRTDLHHFGADLWSRLLEPERWLFVAAAFRDRLDPRVGFEGWGIVWPIAGLALLVWALGGRRTEDPLRFMLWCLPLCWGAWFLVFVGTPLDLAWHVRTALDRLILQLLPLTLAAGFAAAASTRPRSTTIDIR